MLQQSCHDDDDDDNDADNSPEHQSDLSTPTSQFDPATILGLPRTLVLGYTEFSEGYRMQLADDV